MLIQFCQQVQVKRFALRCAAFYRRAPDEIAVAALAALGVVGHTGLHWDGAKGDLRFRERVAAFGEIDGRCCGEARNRQEGEGSEEGDGGCR